MTTLYDVADLEAEVRRLREENDSLRKQVAGHCRRIAEQSELLGRAAERSADWNLGAWLNQSDYHEAYIQYVDGWRVELTDGATRRVVVYDRPQARPLLSNGMVREVALGTESAPAPVEDVKLRALEVWREVYGG